MLAKIVAMWLFSTGNVASPNEDELLVSNADHISNILYEKNLRISSKILKYLLYIEIIV